VLDDPTFFGAVVKALR